MVGKKQKKPAASRVDKTFEKGREQIYIITELQD
jgi:hypothetical protein